MAQDTLAPTRRTTPSHSPTPRDRKGKSKLIIPEEQENVSATSTSLNNTSQNQQRGGSVGGGVVRASREPSAGDVDLRSASPGYRTAGAGGMLRQVQIGASSSATNTVSLPSPALSSRKRSLPPASNTEDEDLVIVEDGTPDLEVISVHQTHLGRKRVRASPPLTVTSSPSIPPSSSSSTRSRSRTAAGTSTTSQDEDNDPSIMIIHERLPSTPIVIISDDDEPVVSRVQAPRRETLTDTTPMQTGETLARVRRNVRRVPNIHVPGSFRDSGTGRAGSSSSLHASTSSHSSSSSSLPRYPTRSSQPREFHRDRVAPVPGFLISDGEDFGSIFPLPSTRDARSHLPHYARQLSATHQHLFTGPVRGLLNDLGGYAAPSSVPSMTAAAMAGMAGGDALGMQGLVGYEELLRLEESMGEVKRPTPKAVVNGLKELKVTSDKFQGESCSICLEHYTPRQKVNILPCEHVFHTTCIRKWLGANRTCPVCRESLVPSPKMLRKRE